MDYTSDIEVKNVALPENVVRELKRLGRALESYSSGELRSAVVACHMDGNLIDDPNGANFMDQLELTEAEKKKAQGLENTDEEDGEKENDKSKHKNRLVSFCKRLAESRRRQREVDKELNSA